MNLPAFSEEVFPIRVFAQKTVLENDHLIKQLSEELLGKIPQKVYDAIHGKIGATQVQTHIFIIVHDTVKKKYLVFAAETREVGGSLSHHESRFVADEKIKQLVDAGFNLITLQVELSDEWEGIRKPSEGFFAISYSDFLSKLEASPFKDEFKVGFNPDTFGKRTPFVPLSVRSGLTKDEAEGLMDDFLKPPIEIQRELEKMLIIDKGTGKEDTKSEAKYTKKMREQLIKKYGEKNIVEMESRLNVKAQ